MKILAARKYVSPRVRPLTPDEAETRRLSYALKAATTESVWTAAEEMAPLILENDVVLSAIPTSYGDHGPNRKLANRIADHIRARGGRARVIVTVGRMNPVESSCARRRRGLCGLAIEDHALTRICGPLPAVALYFIDNVTTTGNTLRAARAALGYGDAVCFADASTRRNQQEPRP